MKYPLLTLTALIISAYSYACDCDGMKGEKEADVVFKGKVEKIQKLELPYRRYEITFQITEEVKGIRKEKNIVVDVPCLTDGCCGIAFEVGQLYRVCAYKQENRVKTNQCWETERLVGIEN